MPSNNNNEELSKLNNFLPSEEEIDLSVFLKVIDKSKKLILITTASLFSLGCIYGLLQKHIWQGEFQIVISNKESNNSESFQSLPFLNLNKTNTPLLTEVEILKSPSVLLPIYESYLKRFDYDKKTLPFKKWKKDNLSVNIVPGTNILEFKYNDSNKEEIKPTLKRIVNIYKEYSPKQKIELLDYRISYLQDQIATYNEKYQESYEKAIAFSLENGLTTSFDSDLYVKNIGNNDSLLINRIEILISELESIEQADELIAFANANKISSEFIIELTKQLLDLIKKIELKKNVFTLDDISIKNLEKEKLTLSRILKTEILSSLNFLKDSGKLRIKTANSSKDILIQNKKNIKEAKKLESILLSFQADLRATEFKLKEKSIPWKLITDPIVENRPIKPSKRKIALLWALFGAFVSTTYTILKHLRKDIVISENEIKNLLSIPLIDKIKLDKEVDINAFEVLKNGIFSQYPSINVSLFCIGNISDKDLTKLKNVILKDKNKIFQIKSKLKDITTKDLLIFVVSMNNLYRRDLQDLKNKIELNRFSVFGFILLTD